MKKITLGILGTGYLGGIIGDAWQQGLLEGYELVGVCGRNGEKTAAMAEKYGVPGFRQVEDLLALRPDYIAEAASVGAVRDHALDILGNGTNLVVLSIGAFADREFYEKTAAAAAENGVRVHIASGAVGGFDVLRTVMLMDQATAQMEAFKNPGRFEKTPLNREGLAGTREPVQVFSGTAQEAIALLPTQVNVAVAAALATTGPEQMEIRISGVPDFVGDEHRITARTRGVRAVVDIYCSTAAIAGWSVVACLRNLVSPIVF